MDNIYFSVCIRDPFFKKLLEERGPEKYRQGIKTAHCWFLFNGLTIIKTGDPYP